MSWDVLLVGFIVAAVATLVAGLRLWKRLGTAKFAVAFLWFAGITAVVVVLVRVGGCADPPAPFELERVGSKLVHPFGFEVAAPPASFTPDHELEKRLSTSYMQCWAWSSSSTFVVCGLDSEVHSRAELDADVDAIRRGVDRAADSLRTSSWIHATAVAADAPPDRRGTATLEAMSAAIPRWGESYITWTDGHGDARLTATLAGATIHMRLLTVEGGLAIAWTMGPTSSELVDSLKRR